MTKLAGHDWRPRPIEAILTGGLHEFYRYFQFNLNIVDQAIYKVVLRADVVIQGLQVTMICGGAGCRTGKMLLGRKSPKVGRPHPIH